MRKRIKKFLISFFMALICGVVFGRLVYQIYDNKMEVDYFGEKVYLIQAGAYDTYDKMIKDTSANNYLYYEDEGVFKSIIGITKNNNNIKKIKDSYGKDVVVSEYYSKDKELNKRIKYYDDKMLRTDNKSEIMNVIIESLDLYKGNKKKNLVKISS